MRRYLLLILGLFVAIAIIGCSVPPAPVAPPSEAPAVETTRTPGLQLPDEAVKLVQTVRVELAKRLDQADERINVVDVESAEWSTAAMGCPEPDKMYAQVTTSGYIVRLRTDSRTYEVHVSDDGTVVFCDGEALALPEEVRTLVQKARTALAERLDQANDAVTFLDVESAEWPTAAMGCPEPDQMYAQVLTPGYIVRLRANDEVYEVHISKGGRVVFCDAGKESRGMEVPAAAEPAVMAAKRDLASRASVKIEDVEVTSFEAVEWSDSSLGCPQPGQMYAQVITPGYRVILKAAGQTYEYHTDRGNRAVLCSGGPAEAALQKQQLDEIRGVVERARNDLAQRLNIDPTAISVAQALPVSQVEQLALCPAADQLAGLGKEYQVTLTADGDTYVYRALGESIVICEQ